jgi:hypothetical protein
MERVEQRKLTVGLSATEARRRRDETNVQLRKQRRDEQLKKRREQVVETPRSSGPGILTDSFSQV